MFATSCALKARPQMPTASMPPWKYRPVKPRLSPILNWLVFVPSLTPPVAVATSAPFH
jgi:hypothetical protein